MSIEPKLITHDGKTQSIGQWAREKGMQSSTLCKRLKTMSVADALDTPLASVPYGGKGGHQPTFLTWNGKTQKLSEWAKDTGLPLSLIAKRHKRGWEPDRVLEPVKDKTDG